MMRFVRRFCRNRSAVIGTSVLLIVLLMALSAPGLYPRDPFQLAGPPMVEPMRQGFMLGTDTLGRDVAAGVVHGARTTLLIASIATVVAVFIGVVIGGLSGFFGGRIDAALTHFTQFFQTIPSFLFAIVLVAVLGPTMTNVIAAIALVTWPPLARLARGEFMSMRNRDFVNACICAGIRDSKIIVTHILPNCAPALIVTASLMVANAVLIESSLSFLGLSDPNVMTWGLMIGAGRVALRSGWWICVMPGLAILLTVLAINLAGDGLNDTLNPRLKNAND